MAVQQPDDSNAARESRGLVVEANYHTATNEESPQTQETQKKMHDLFSLPAELRQLIYEELLVTDCALRLGHHGPYTHIPHRKLHPSILRTNRAIYAEAAPVLYGYNTFFLGPIGHKPTYSASFISSVGAHNAARIRVVVAHSVYPPYMRRHCVERWLKGLGIDVQRLRILAVSFGEHSVEKVLPSNGHVHTHAQVHVHVQVHVHIHGGAVTGQTLQSQMVPLTTHAHANPQPTNLAALHLGVGPLGNPHLHNNHHHHHHHQHNHHQQQQQHAQAVTPGGQTPNGGFPVTLSASTAQAGKDKVVLDDFADAATKTTGWLEQKRKAEVADLVCLNNTDLRAGEKWLVYVSPAAKRKMANV